jgi:uroporphyrinogen decarboxylase
MIYAPDYNNILTVLYNEKPKRLPLYEHYIDLPFMNRYFGREIVLQGNKQEDYRD